MPEDSNGWIALAIIVAPVVTLASLGIVAIIVGRQTTTVHFVRNRNGDISDIVETTRFG